MNHPEIGLIGIAGAKYKSKTPSGWSNGNSELDCCNIHHQDKEGHRFHIYLNPNKIRLEPVVNVDGVFIAIRREVWKTARFNEINLRGFHLYDIDFSFHVVRHWKAAVLFNIDIMHFTQGGNYGDAWVEPTLHWHALFSNQLPQSIWKSILPENLSKKNQCFLVKTFVHRKNFHRGTNGNGSGQAIHGRIPANGHLSRCFYTGKA